MTEPRLPDNAEILLYGTEDGAARIDVLYRDESFWLTQKRMAELFGVQRPAITKHLKNIFETRELEEDRVVSILETTAADGKTYRTQYYNLDAIIAVGYRVNSCQVRTGLLRHSRTSGNPWTDCESVGELDGSFPRRRESMKIDARTKTGKASFPHACPREGGGGNP